MRNHNKLQAFHLADRLAQGVYRVTQTFPKEERYVLVSQLRRAALSAPSNIVEGCARRSETDFLRFLDIAYGSEAEVRYQLSFARRQGYISSQDYREIERLGEEAARKLGALIRALRAQ